MINFIQVGSIITDIVIIAVFIISICQAFKRGLTMVIFQFVSLIVTLIAVLLLCKPITNFVVDKTGIDEFFSSKIESTLGKAFEENFTDGTLIKEDSTNISSSVVKMINNYITDAKQSSANSIAKFVADKLSYIVVSAIVVIVLCIVIRIATYFLKYLLYALSHLPIIRTLDKSGGAVYGLLRAYLIIYFILAILSLLSPLLADTGLIAVIKASKICSVFYNNNILLKIFG